MSKLNLFQRLHRGADARRWPDSRWPTVPAANDFEALLADVDFGDAAAAIEEAAAPSASDATDLANTESPRCRQPQPRRALPLPPPIEDIDSNVHHRIGSHGIRHLHSAGIASAAPTLPRITVCRITGDCGASCGTCEYRMR